VRVTCDIEKTEARESSLRQTVCPSIVMIVMRNRCTLCL
jgi:hypothetical protein